MMGYVACLSIAAFILLSLTYIFYSLDYFNNVNDSLERELDIVEAAYLKKGLDGVLALEEKKKANSLFGRFAYALADKNKQKLAGTLESWPEYFTWSDGWYSFEMDFLNYQGISTPFNFVARTRDLPDDRILMVARVADDIRQNIQLVSATLFWSMVIVSFLGLIGAVIISRLSLARVESINQTIRKIMDGNLSDRITVNTREDDFQTLAINLNAMFERIESSMNDVRQVSDNIAHDLRTPLTRIRNRLSTMEKRALDEKEKTDYTAIVSEADGLLATFSALLRISQIESGSKKSNFKPFNLSQTITDVCELYEPLAQDKGIAMEVVIQPDFKVMGDNDLIFQMLANIVDNAIKYSNKDGNILIKCSAVLHKVRIVIADDGPGIDSEKINKVFQRFYRVESSRGIHPGNGLGLSLVKAVIELHKGVVMLNDSKRLFPSGLAPGLSVTIDLNRVT